jgi:hypothetical protein
MIVFPIVFFDRCVSDRIMKRVEGMGSPHLILIKRVEGIGSSTLT